MQKDRLWESCNAYIYADEIKEMKARKVRPYRRALVAKIIKGAGAVLVSVLFIALAFSAMLIMPD
jgi:hypothetical protein